MYRVVEQLKRDRRNLFADDWAGLPGTRLADGFVEAPPERCKGRMDVATPIDVRSGSAAMVRGAAWDVSEDETPSFVAITDAEGIIKGLGSFLRILDEDVSTDRGWPWRGFIADFEPSQRYAAYAVLSEERVACPLRVPRPQRGRGRRRR